MYSACLSQKGTEHFVTQRCTSPEDDWRIRGTWVILVLSFLPGFPGLKQPDTRSWLCWGQDLSRNARPALPFPIPSHLLSLNNFLPNLLTSLVLPHARSDPAQCL